MRKALIVMSMLAFAAAGSSACATKGYVRNQVGQVSSKVDTLSQALEQTQERVRTTETRIGEVDTKAGAAQSSADRAGTAAGADFLEFTQATFAAQQIRFAQFGKEGGILPDFGEGLAADVPGCHRQVAAGEDLAAMADEGDAGTGQAAFGHGVHGVTAVAIPTRMPTRVPVAAMLLPVQGGRPFAENTLSPLLCLPLPRNAEVMRRTGGLQLNIPFHFRVIHPV